MPFSSFQSTKANNPLPFCLKVFKSPKKRLDKTIFILLTSFKTWPEFMNKWIDLKKSSTTMKRHWKSWKLKREKLPSKLPGASSKSQGLAFRLISSNKRLKWARKHWKSSRQSRLNILKSAFRLLTFAAKPLFLWKTKRNALNTRIWSGIIWKSTS